MLAQIESLGGVYSSFPPQHIPEDFLESDTGKRYKRVYLIIDKTEAVSKRDRTFMRLTVFDGLVETQLLAFESVALLRERLLVGCLYRLSVRQ